MHCPLLLARTDPRLLDITSGDLGSSILRLGASFRAQKTVTNFIQGFEVTLQAKGSNQPRSTDSSWLCTQI